MRPLRKTLPPVLDPSLRHRSEAVDAAKSLTQSGSVTAVLAVVFAHTGVSSKQLCQPTRGTKTVATARQAAYWLLRQQGMSYHEIAGAFGRGNHDVPMRGCKRMDRLRRADPGLDTLLADMLRDVREHRRTRQQLREQTVREVAGESLDPGGIGSEVHGGNLTGGASFGKWRPYCWGSR